MPRNTTNKEVNDLYDKTDKTLLKEVRDERHKWKTILCSWIEKINIIKMGILPKNITDLMLFLSNY